MKAKMGFGRFGALWVAAVALNGSQPLMAGESAVDSPIPAKLPVFSDGAWKGMHAVVQGKNYEAAIDAKGGIQLFPLDKNTRVGKPININYGCNYADTEKKETGRRPIMNFDDAPTAPAELRPPVSLSISGQCEDKVSLTLLYKFTETSVSFSALVKDPARVKYPSTLSYSVVFAPTHKPPPEMKLDEIKALMPGWELRLTKKTGKTKAYPYWAGLSSQPGITKAQIFGPWGQRKVTVFAPCENDRKTNEAITPAEFNIYPCFAPYTGYYLKRFGSANREPGELRLQFD